MSRCFLKKNCNKQSLLQNRLTMFAKDFIIYKKGEKAAEETCRKDRRYKPMGDSSHRKYITELLRREIADGKLGVSGAEFYTVRELAEKYSLSPMTAQSIFKELAAYKVITLVGKKYYLTNGPMDKTSPLSLHREKTNRIGFHTNDLTNPYLSLIAAETEKYARNIGYSVIIQSSMNDMSTETQILENFFRLNVCGIISCPNKGVGLTDVYRNYPLPYVFLSHSVAGVNADFICVNNILAGKSVAKTLLDHGYKTFVYVTEQPLETALHDQRFLGFRLELNEHGIDFGQNGIMLMDSSMSHANLIVRRFISAHERPIGFFCRHDLLAVNLLNICLKNNIDIPNDVGIIGFDNLSLTEQIKPSLSTIDYNTRELTKLAVQTLLARIHDPFHPTAVTMVNPILLTRTSSARLIEKQDPDL